MDEKEQQIKNEKHKKTTEENSEVKKMNEGNNKYENMDPEEAMAVVRENAEKAVSIGKSLGIEADPEAEKKMERAFRELGKIINRGRSRSKLNEEVSSRLPQSIFTKVFYALTDTIHITDKDNRYKRRTERYEKNGRRTVHDAIKAYTLNVENVINPIMKEACSTHRRLVSELEKAIQNNEIHGLEIKQLKKNIDENSRIKSAISSGKKIFDKQTKEDVKEIDRTNSYHNSVISTMDAQFDVLASYILEKEGSIKKYEAAIEKLRDYRFIVNEGKRKISELEELPFMENIDMSIGNFVNYSIRVTPDIKGYSDFVRKKEEVSEDQFAKLLALNAVDVGTEESSATIHEILSQKRKGLAERVDTIIKERAC